MRCLFHSIKCQKCLSAVALAYLPSFSNLLLIPTKNHQAGPWIKSHSWLFCAQQNRDPNAAGRSMLRSRRPAKPRGMQHSCTIHARRDAKSVRLHAGCVQGPGIPEQVAPNAHPGKQPNDAPVCPRIDSALAPQACESQKTHRETVYLFRNATKGHLKYVRPWHVQHGREYTSNSLPPSSTIQIRRFFAPRFGSEYSAINDARMPLTFTLMVLLPCLTRKHTDHKTVCLRQAPASRFRTNYGVYHAALPVL